MAPETCSSVTSEVVVAYFSSSADAQRAIDDLLGLGFEPRQIGAAFRSGCSPASRTSAVYDIEEIDRKPELSAVDRDTRGSGGPTSGTSAVTPAGLSTGSGSVISGGGHPGPIPGSDIPRHHSAGPVETTSTETNPLPATGGFHQTHDEDSWWQKVKNLFSSDTSVEGRSKGVASETSMNFSTGEGHLGTYPDNYDYAYSGAAFEGAFSGMGVNPTNARSLVGDLQLGGAIVSVDTAGRSADAQGVLERNNGRIRYEAAAEATQWSEIPGERVRVFGRLSRTYPDYLPGSDVSSRKAP
jgi:hypothetical protein